MYDSKKCTCGMQPCRCDLSITTSSCFVDLCVSVPTCPPSVTPPVVTPPVVTPPAIDLKDFLKLLDMKCDKATCKLLSEEMALLYLLLDLDMDNINPIVPGGVVQKITNMVINLNGDLTGKYPSAILLKEELVKLWKCLSNKLQHHGEWKDNWSYRDISLLPGGNCGFEHGKDPAPGKIKVITPVDVGSTVFHDIEGKHCLFESLVDNNITEPSKLAVLEGKWMSYCDLREVINCVLPRKIITNCKDKCDDPNGDGVHEDLTLCKRVSNLEECVICTVIDTNTVDLTKAKLPDNGSTTKPSQVGNSIKADVKYQNSPSVVLSENSKGLKADIVVDPKGCNAIKVTAAGMHVESSPLKVVDTHTVDMTLAKDGCNDKLKADVILDPDAKNIIKATSKGLLAHEDHVKNFELVTGPHGTHEYKITMKNGGTFTAKCCGGNDDIILSDEHTFTQQTVSVGQTDVHKTIDRAGGITIKKAGTYQIFMCQIVYYDRQGAQDFPNNTTFGFAITKNKHIVGPMTWTNDHDNFYGAISDHVGNAMTIAKLKVGDVVSAKVNLTYRAGPPGAGLTGTTATLLGTNTPSTWSHWTPTAYVVLVRLGD